MICLFWVRSSNILYNYFNKSISGRSGYICHGDEGRCYPVRNNWMYEKIAQLWIRLDTVSHILVKKLLYQQGYIVVRGAYWLDMLKWLRNPEYYRINKKYDFEYFIKISDCKKYSGKLTEVQHIYDSQSLKKYDILGKNLTVNFSDWDNNSELVRRIFQIPGRP